MKIIINYQGQRPTQTNADDAGYDLRASESITVPTGSCELVKTGCFVAIPRGFCGMVCSRSGLALKRGVFVLNAPGIIDSGYRDQIGVILFNAGNENFDIKIGDRIAQLLITPIMHPEWINAPLDDTQRGTNGFGSSGVAA